LGIRFLYI